MDCKGKIHFFNEFCVNNKITHCYVKRIQKIYLERKRH